MDNTQSYTCACMHARTRTCTPTMLQIPTKQKHGNKETKNRHLNQSTLQVKKKTRDRSHIVACIHSKGSCLVEFDAACAWRELSKIVCIGIDSVTHVDVPLLVVVGACAVGKLPQEDHVRLIMSLVLWPRHAWCLHGTSSLEGRLTIRQHYINAWKGNE
jgi:hypothetical protein